MIIISSLFSLWVMIWPSLEIDISENRTLTIFFSFLVVVSLHIPPFPTVGHYRIFSHNFTAFNLFKKPFKVFSSVLILQMKRVRLMMTKWFPSQYEPIIGGSGWGRGLLDFKRSCFQIAPCSFHTLLGIIFIATYSLYFPDSRGSFLQSWYTEGIQPST